MLNFIQKIFDTSDFPARWHCGSWTPGHGWLHIISDLGTWGAYTAIPCVLAFYVIRKRDVAFPRIFWLFGAFIFACGTVHLVEATIFWWPAYRFSGVVKLWTAIISWATVIAMVRIAPQAMALPGLAAMNDQLRREVNERRRAEAAQRKTNNALREKNREMEQFGYTVSHDLKSPLVTIMGFVGLLREDVEARRFKEADDSIGRIEGATRRMSQLIDDLLALSRVGRAMQTPVEVDVRQMVHSIAEGLAPRLEAAGATLEVQPDVPRVPADAERLREALDNLLTNAIKYGCTAAVPKITVGGNVVGDEARLFVKDNGPGIAAEYHERIFELFQRLQNGGEGTGVGLAIVAKIAAAHGGRAWVESSPGQGSVFWLALPVAPHA